MALTFRTLTGDLRNLQNVPFDAPAFQAWIVSSKTVIVDGDANRVHVGTRVRLPLVGSTFTVSLPDSGEAGVLYSLVGMWVEPAGARQVGPSKLGDFHLTANADIADVLITTGGDLPQTVVDELRDEIAAVALPPGGSEGQVLAKATGADYDTAWVAPGGGGGGVSSVNDQTGAVVLDADDVGVIPAGLDTTGLARAVWLTRDAPVPGGLPDYTLIIRLP